MGKGGTNEARKGQRKVPLPESCCSASAEAFLAHLAVLLLLLAGRCYWSTHVHPSIRVLCFLLRWL